MTQKPSRKQIGRAVKIFTTEEAKTIAIASIQESYGITKHLKELAEKQLPTVTFGEASSVAENLNLNKIALAYSLESGYALMESIDIHYSQLALQMKIDLEKEFSCNTTSERSLVDQVVNSYIRKLSFSKFLEERKDQKFLSNEKNGYLSFISKEIDRAHRQFLSGLETLKAIKQPALNVNIKAQNTFVAQNQQINNPSEKINEAT